MTGTFINAAGILAGGLYGLARRRGPARENKFWFNTVPCVFVVFYGLRLTWISLNGSGWAIPKQLLVVVLALGIGRVLGRLMGLQDLSNQAGRAALERITREAPPGAERFGRGFQGSAILFCLSPLGWLGAVQDGLGGYYYSLCVKAWIEGLACWGWAPRFGWGVLASVLPVVALQGTVTILCAQLLQPFLAAHGLIDSIQAVGGLLTFCVGLITLGIKKLPLADYLPSLAVAPVLTWLFH